MKPPTEPTSRGTHVANEDGMALPLAMLVLVILTSLSIAFTSLARTEPVVARNQILAAQARALAESGVERAIWALSNPTVSTYGIPTTMGTSAGSPYNGDPITVSTAGTIKITVTRPASGLPDNERIVVAVGLASGQGTATRKIQTTVMQFDWPGGPPQCALCVRGALTVGGNADIDARYNQCSGVTPIGGAAATGTITAPSDPGDPSTIYGPDNSIPNETADRPVVAESALKLLTADDFNTLRALAKAYGTYLQGPQHFTSAPPSGIVFVDSLTGIDANPSLSEEASGTVTLSGNFTWSGWLIAAGDVRVTGTVSLTGMIYAQNDFTFTGNGDVRGAVGAQNLMSTTETAVATLSGTANITYDCPAARNAGGTLPTTTWFMKPGTFVETSGS